MTRDEHIAEAERYLDTAKDVAKRPKETDQDRKRDEIIVLDLLGFSRCHAEIAQAIGRPPQYPTEA